MQIHTINVEKYGFCLSEFATVMSAIININVVYINQMGQYVGL